VRHKTTQTNSVALVQTHVLYLIKAGWA